MKIYSHVVTVDAGLAPNPFHGYCTSAVCTPSHMNARLKERDWLIGHSPAADGQRLVYAMRISEVVSMDDYFRDRRFKRKKPTLTGRAEDQCGDNMYYRQPGGHWCRLPSHLHSSAEDMAHDVGLFVSQHFYYFGDNRVPIPVRFRELVQDRHGLKKRDATLTRS